MSLKGFLANHEPGFKLLREDAGGVAQVRFRHYCAAFSFW